MDYTNDYYVTYATRMHNEVYRIMPHAIKIMAHDKKDARVYFHRVFKECFGDDLQYKILNISLEKGLTVSA